MCFKDIMKTLPLVTVAVPSYNHENYIEQCIKSILNQTYHNIEIIVIDDGSTDKSPEILTALKEKYGFELIIQKNQGISKTINNILRTYARGKYFAICASDDYWPPEKIEKQVTFMENNRFYPMCYGKTYYVNENSQLETKYDFLNLNLRGGHVFEDILCFKLHPPVNYMFRTEVFQEIGYYDENNKAEDYYMNLKISEKYAIGFLNEFLSFYRTPSVIERVEKFDVVSDAHFITLQDYKYHPLYFKARRIVYLRKFDMFSGFKSMKRKALLNLFKSINLFYHRRFLIACIKMFFFWK